MPLRLRQLNCATPCRPPGFTLVELITVLAIFGALATIAIPLYLKHGYNTTASLAQQQLSDYGINTDTDKQWVYSCTNTPTSTITMTATGKSGNALANTTLTLVLDFTANSITETRSFTSTGIGWTSLASCWPDSKSQTTCP